MMKQTFRNAVAGVRRFAGSGAVLRNAVTLGLAGAALTSLGFRSPVELAKSLGTATARPNPFAGQKLYVDPTSAAWKQAESWAKSRPAEAAQIRKISDQPVAKWVGDWSRDVRGEVAKHVRTATGAGALPVFVAYNIPARDCGSYSAGGAKSADAYRKWIREFAAGFSGKKAAVILEPDALAGMDCLSGKAQEERVGLMAFAVGVLKAAGVAVYLDAGHGRWKSAEVMSSRLERAGIAKADGFALNVSNYIDNGTNVAYGEKLSARVGGKHFVIDSSRNGAGANGEWCNPRGRALGASPTVATGHRLVDAFLWVKRPGESDGTCNGGPAAGKWWPDYALGLAKRQSGAMASR